MRNICLAEGSPIVTVQCPALYSLLEDRKVVRNKAGIEVAEVSKVTDLKAEELEIEMVEPQAGNFMAELQGQEHCGFRTPAGDVFYALGRKVTSQYLLAGFEGDNGIFLNTQAAISNPDLLTPRLIGILDALPETIATDLGLSGLAAAV